MNSKDAQESMEKSIQQYLWRVFANGAGRGADDLVSTGTRQYTGQTDSMVGTRGRLLLILIRKLKLKKLVFRI